MAGWRRESGWVIMDGEIDSNITMNAQKLNFLKAGLPWEAQKAATTAYAMTLWSYLLDNTEPPEKYVSRASAYGPVSSDGAPDGYFSWKQFRYVAAITNGFTDIPYKRTHALQYAWNWDNSGARSERLSNNDPAAPWTIGPNQSRHEEAVGWQFWQNIAHKAEPQALSAATRALSNYFAERL